MYHLMQMVEIENFKFTCAKLICVLLICKQWQRRKHANAVLNLYFSILHHNPPLNLSNKQSNGHKLNLSNVKPVKLCIF